MSDDQRSDEHPEEDIFEIRVLRQKGWPIRPKYVHMVQVEPHPVVTFEGDCLVFKSDFDPETWAEIERRGKLGILSVVLYEAPQDQDPTTAPTRAADDAARAITNDEAGGYFPDTDKGKAPPPLKRVASHIKAPDVNWEESRREMADQRKISPAVRDALSGKEVSAATVPETEDEAKEKRPDKSWRKDRIQAYCNENGIKFEESDYIRTLLAKIENHG